MSRVILTELNTFGPRAKMLGPYLFRLQNEKLYYNHYVDGRDRQELRNMVFRFHSLIMKGL